MATTPAGTAYKATAATLPSGQVVWLGAPVDGATKFVLYTHGAGGTANQFTDNSGPWPIALREWLVDRGFGWVEGTGGGLQPWGNLASQAAYNELINYVEARYAVTQWVVLGRSMGGVVATRIYQARRTSDPRWVGLIINSGTQNLIAQYDYQNGARRPEMNTAWSVSDRAAFVAAVNGLNPIDGPPASWTGARVLQMWGTADDVVVPTTNGEAMRTMYAGRPEIDRVDIRLNGDHSAANGSYKQTSAITAFITDITTPKLTYRTQTWCCRLHCCSPQLLPETDPNSGLSAYADRPGVIVDPYA